MTNIFNLINSLNNKNELNEQEKKILYILKQIYNIFTAKQQIEGATSDFIRCYKQQDDYE